MEQEYIIYPVTEKEIGDLGVSFGEFGIEANEGAVVFVGAMITPSRVREGVRRWIKHGCPNPIEGNEVSSVVGTAKEIISENYAEIFKNQKESAEKQKKLLLDQIEETTATAEREKNLYEARLENKNGRVVELKEELRAEQGKTHQYELRYGELQARPFNWLQRFVGRLFKLID